MANRILTSLDWTDRVRDKVGVDDSHLPDSVLQRPEVITVAEARMIRAIPAWASLVDDDRVFLEAATVAMCAVQVIDSMGARLPKRMKGPDLDIEIEVNWSERKAALEAERNSYLALIDTDDQWVSGFWITGPKR